MSTKIIIYLVGVFVARVSMVRLIEQQGRKISKDLSRAITIYALTSWLAIVCIAFAELNSLFDDKK